MKPVKRLRGHGLEFAKLETEPLTKGDGEQSVLAQTLVSLRSHGQLSAELVQDVARKAILTGCSGHGLATIAKNRKSWVITWKLPQRFVCQLHQGPQDFWQHTS